MLTTLLLLPWAGALAVIAGGRWTPRIEAVTNAAVYVSAGTLAAALATWIRLALAEGANLSVRWSWRSSVATELGADRLGMIFVLLTSVVVLATVLLLAAHATDTTRFRLTLAGILAMEGAANLLFLAADLITFHAAWELTALLGVALVAGGTRSRSGAAALRMLAYLAAGGVGMMLAAARVAALQHTGADPSPFSLLDVASPSLSPAVQTWIAIAIVVACAVRVPLLPLHGWLGPTMIAADPPVAMVVTAVLAQTGVFGLLRLAAALTPDALAALAEPLLWLSVSTLTFAVLAALLQMEMRRRVGWLTMAGGAVAVASVAVDAMGTNSSAMRAAPAQVFVHALAMAALLVVAAAFEARRTAMHDREIGGAGRRMPRFAVALVGAAVAAMAAPLLAGLPVVASAFGGLGTTMIWPGWSMALVVASLAAWPVVLARPLVAACGQRPLDRNRGLRDLRGFELAAVAVLLLSIALALLGWLVSDTDWFVLLPVAITTGSLGEHA